MAILIYAIYFSIAIIIGILASLFGLGGGFLIVPTLTLLGMPVRHAVGNHLLSSFFHLFLPL